MSYLDVHIEAMLELANQLTSSPALRPTRTEIVDAPGKLLRPRLVFLCTAHGEELGGKANWEGARRAALALHLGHTGSLYHDDIVDRSETRRAQPALHHRIGLRRTSLAGAKLLALANSLVSELSPELGKRWARTARQMADGQLRDLESAGSHDISEKQYIETAYRKTGAAFHLAASFGAHFGGVPPAEGETLERFGRRFGTTFQLANDLADFRTAPEAGRPAGNDLRERVYSLPVLYGCMRRDAYGEELRSMLEEDGRPLASQEMSRVIALLEESGAFDRATRRTIQEATEADRELDRLEHTHSRDELRHLVAALVPCVPIHDGPDQKAGLW